MAVGACPVGAAQAFLRTGDFPFFVVGVTSAFALLAGRWFCGWLCPFGLIEDVLDRFSRDRLRLPHQLGYGRYVMLVALIVAPVLTGLAGLMTVFPFCATVCPSGLILGLSPYYLTHGFPRLQEALAQPALHLGGVLIFAAHVFGLLVYLGLALNMSGRFFCRFLCPLGAFLGLFNGVALIRIEHAPAACGSCTSCHSLCPVGNQPNLDDFLTRTGCVRCGRCVSACGRGNKHWVVAGTALKEPQDAH